MPGSISVNVHPFAGVCIPPIKKRYKKVKTPHLLCILSTDNIPKTTEILLIVCLTQKGSMLLL